MIKELWKKIDDNVILQALLFGAIITGIIFLVIVCFWISFWLGVGLVVFGIATAWYLDQNGEL